MKKIVSVIFCFLIIFCFASCDDSTSEAKKAEQNPIEISFTFNEEKSIGHKVWVDTTLPVGTLVTVDIKSGDYFYSTEEIAVKGDIDTNYIVTEAQKTADGENIKNGNYFLDIQTVDVSRQPSSVREKIGEKGELMKAAASDLQAVKIDDNDQTKHYAKFLRTITKKGEKFKIAQ